MLMTWFRAALQQMTYCDGQGICHGEIVTKDNLLWWKSEPPLKNIYNGGQGWPPLGSDSPKNCHKKESEKIQRVL